MNNKVKVPIKLTLAVVAACLVSFCGLITETAVNIAFPAVMDTFGVSTKTVQWLTTGNLLVVAMITPLSAFLQKRFKLKQLFIFGTMCFLLGTVVAIFSPNFAFLLLARLIQGVGTGVGVPIAFCIILEQIPFEKVGTYMGYGTLVEDKQEKIYVPVSTSEITLRSCLTKEEIGWRAVYRWEYTKMKMINVVTDKKICYNIYTMCKNKKGKEMEIKDEIKKLRESTGMNRKEFCEYFEIPYRTVTEWERGTRKMPDYVLRLLAYKVKMDNLIVKEDVNEE